MFESARTERTYPAQKGKNRFVFVVDVRKCIGCDACVAACKAERNTPLGVFNTWVEKWEIGYTDPNTGETKVKVLNVPKLCNHCGNGHQSKHIGLSDRNYRFALYSHSWF